MRIPLLIAGLIVAAGPVFAADWREAPQQADGLIDFVSIINAEFDPGVAPDDNAFVALLDVMSFDTWDAAHREALFAVLGIPEPDEPSVRLIWWDDYAAERLPIQEARDIPFDALFDPWTAREQSLAAAWLKTNKPALARVAQAVRKPTYFAPLPHVTGNDMVIGVLLPQLVELRMMAKALCIRAAGHIGEGDVDAAIDDVIVTKRMAQLVQNEQQTIGQLVAMSIESMTRNQVQAIIASESLSFEQATRLQDAVRVNRMKPTMLRMIDRTEQCMILDALQHVAKRHEGVIEMIGGEAPNAVEKMSQLADRPEFDVEQAMSHFDGLMGQFVAQLEDADYEAVKVIDDEWDQYFADFRRSDRFTALAKMGVRDPLPDELAGDAYTIAVTELVVGFLYPAMGSAIRTEMQVAMFMDLQETGLALRRYRFNHDGYPDSLDALSPRYLDHAPVDLTGGPLIYRPRDDGFLLYSVGGNGVDDGGRDDLSDGDYVVAVP